MSDIFEKTVELSQKQKVISHSNPLWEDLSAIVLKWSPEFKRKLICLSKGKISEAEYNTALLIKLGFSPTKIAYLTGRERGTVNSRRQTLGSKLLLQNKRLDDIGRIISLL